MRWPFVPGIAGRAAHDDAGERGARRRPGERRQRQSGDQRRWPLGGVRVRRQQSGGGRHERPVRRLRARPADGDDDAGERRARRRPGERRQLGPRRSAPTAAGWRSSPTASNLVAGDTNGQSDVFVHDRQTGTTTRVSVGPGGAPGERAPATARRSAPMAAGWRSQSEASNLVAGDTNGCIDVFVHDRQTGTTTRVSVGPGGAQGNGGSCRPAISADGRCVAFYVPGQQPGGRRHERRRGRVRARPADGDDDARERGPRRRAGRTATAASLGDQRRRPLGGVRLRWPAIWWRATRTATATCSSTTGRPGRRRG